MRLVSYAQNLEDVILWRALKHVEVGFYIDVGANDPSVDSVTRVFYERGWHGINIEPLDSHYADLKKDRPRDINLQCAAGSGHGEIDVWDCEVRGWATASAEIASQHKANGYKGTFRKAVVAPLKEICNKHVAGDIHFLKIDVEGFEHDVIEGMDFSKFRPWVLIIEATRPNSATEAHLEWEGSILSSDYVLAYMDGLNRFYVAREHGELLGAFQYPPNVFDDYIRSEHLSAMTRAQQAETRAQQAEALAKQTSTVLESLYASWSWRITRPLRETKAFMRSFIGTTLRQAVSKGRILVLRVPALKRPVLWMLLRFPVFGHLVTRFSATHQSLGRGQQVRIRRFEQLRSVRMMHALSQLSFEDCDSPVSFLTMSNDAN